MAVCGLCPAFVRQSSPEFHQNFTRMAYIYIYIYMCFHAISPTGKLIGAGSGRVYNGRCRQPPRLAQASLVR